MLGIFDLGNWNDKFVMSVGNFLFARNLYLLNQLECIGNFLCARKATFFFFSVAVVTVEAVVVATIVVLMIVIVVYCSGYIILL